MWLILWLKQLKLVIFLITEIKTHHGIMIRFKFPLTQSFLSNLRSVTLLHHNLPHKAAVRIQWRENDGH